MKKWLVVSTLVMLTVALWLFVSYVVESLEAPSTALVYVIPPDDSITVLEKQWAPFVDYLSGELGRPVEFIVGADAYETFTDTEKAYLKRYWGNHWQMGMKSFLVRAMEEKKDDDIEKGLVKDAFQALFATLEADGIDRDRVKKIMRRWLDKDGV